MLHHLLMTAVLAGTGTPTSAQDYPFIGHWDCQIATFTFDRQGYHNGSDYLPYVAVTDEGGNWIIDFDGGYQIGLSGITDTAMQWLSFASGDTFDCIAIR